jgi:hypothetical protein
VCVCVCDCLSVCVCVCVCVCVQSNSRPAPAKAKAPCVLDITGVRAQRVEEDRYTSRRVREGSGAAAWRSLGVRQQLYKNNAHLATSIAKLVLESAGHPLTLCIDEIDRAPPRASTFWTTSDRGAILHPSSGHHEMRCQIYYSCN